ncbi:hypothetical protein FZEAL_2546 [Fusarium zealandicum]|uniref:Xylanolytic transcriptional activator regulatory domain-containing protein n=1 Tax=Fusarium zealandicum TaxID=1053134 RepID=A0A8H4URB5_9HYPO|nr:hypothetical protein FZEAL_2546 [Fusarium zealandicum]
MLRPTKVEKRNRPPKSCEFCRGRKGNDALCQYASNADRHKNEGVAERLKNLEDLITTMAQRNSVKGSMSTLNRTDKHSLAEDEVQEGDLNTGSSINTRTTNSGSSDFGVYEAHHLDSNHWSSILANIKALRNEWLAPSPQPQSSTAASSTQDTQSSLDETVDLDLSSETILHPVKFYQEYESFWEAPTEAPIVWVGLLFAILSLAATVYEISDVGSGSKPTLPSATTLCKRTEQCLVLGKYVKSNQHAVEALLVLLGSCYMRAKDSDINLWFLMGTVVRLAILKGYHRDSTKTPGSNISAFEGEMRRRVWATISQVDALLSFQMGLPSMIPSEYCDTELPRNLNYSDFYPAIAELPPSRPSSDYTPILYTIVKASVMSIFKKVVDHTRSLLSSPYEKTIALDSSIRHVYNSLPNDFKYKPLRQSVVDSTGIIMHRVTIEMLHLKSIVVLHRQYSTHWKDSCSKDSRDACLEAARTVLERQVELHEAIQPGCQLHYMRWMITTLTMNDFILAAMVICLDLTIRVRQAATERNVQVEDDFERNLSAIRIARHIWKAAETSSSEARTTAHALDSTIERINTYVSSISHPQRLQPVFTSAITPNYAAWDTTEQTSYMADGTDYIDWSLLDNHFQDAGREELDLDLWLLDSAGHQNFDWLR